MKALLKTDLADKRVLGLSLGLEYDPAYYSTVEELKFLSPEVGYAGKLIASHVRGEYAWEIESASKELVEIARAGKCAFSHTHIKIAASSLASSQTLPHELIDRIFDAPRLYPEIPSAWADVYPWTASATGLFYFFPSWARAYSDVEYYLYT
ncbi:hypothetical protein GEMRC1_002076 [Eukaryota sp. GEM-RC1]